MLLTTHLLPSNIPSATTHIHTHTHTHTHKTGTKPNHFTTNMSAYYRKADFMTYELAPFFQPPRNSTSCPESCCICLKDVAFEAASTSPPKRLNPADKTFLEASLDMLSQRKQEQPRPRPRPRLSEAEKAFLEEIIAGTKTSLDLLALRREEARLVEDAPFPSPKEVQHAAVRIRACGHVFGLACIKEWLQDKNSCPMCRKILFMPGSGQPGQWW